MALTFDELFQILLPILGQESVAELGEKIGGMSLDADEEWKKTVLTLVADAIEKHGSQGVELAVEAVQDMLADRPPKLDWADLKLASDIVAYMQNAEADHKREVNDYIVKVSKVAGIILGTLIKALVAG